MPHIGPQTGLSVGHALACPERSSRHFPHGCKTTGRPQEFGDSLENPRRFQAIENTLGQFSSSVVRRGACPLISAGRVKKSRGRSAALNLETAVDAVGRSSTCSVSSCRAIHFAQSVRTAIYKHLRLKEEAGRPAVSRLNSASQRLCGEDLACGSPALWPECFSQSLDPHANLFPGRHL
jgi:hypothetical protein